MTKALSQQEAARGHRLEARLEELSQRVVLLMVLHGGGRGYRDNGAGRCTGTDAASV